MTRLTLLMPFLASLCLWAQGVPVPAEPPGAPAEPAGVPAEPAKAPVEPVKAPAEPAGVPAEPAKASVEPAGVPVEEATIPDDGVRVAVLGYHEFSDTQPETAMRLRTVKFRNQMETIRQLGITVISLNDFMAWRRGEMKIPEKSVLLTFDDGWKSVYTDAWPILKEFNYPFTLYLYKNYVDGGGKALTSAMIQEMVKAGATIGSHSISHSYPATVKKFQQEGADAYDGFLRKEMGESKRFLESRFGVKITTYAYPGGYHTEEMLTLGREFGYAGFFTVVPGKVKRATPDEALTRYIILGNHDGIFDLATRFHDAQAPGGDISGTAQVTPYPVRPESGAIINSRLPEISADLTNVENLDPATLVMQVSGFGDVPAKYDAATRRFSWQVNRRLRQPGCQVCIRWKDSAGKPVEPALRWSFQIDRASAYLPDH